MKKHKNKNLLAVSYKTATCKIEIFIVGTNEERISFKSFALIDSIASPILSLCDPFCSLLLFTEPDSKRLIFIGIRTLENGKNQILSFISKKQKFGFLQMREVEWIDMIRNLYVYEGCIYFYGYGPNLCKLCYNNLN